MTLEMTMVGFVHYIICRIINDSFPINVVVTELATVIVLQSCVSLSWSFRFRVSFRTFLGVDKYFSYGYTVVATSIRRPYFSGFIFTFSVPVNFSGMKETFVMHLSKAILPELGIFGSVWHDLLPAPVVGTGGYVSPLARFRRPA